MMDHERKELLAQKKAQLKVKQQRAEIQQYKDHFTKSIQYFSQKYRYADEAEAIKLVPSMASPMYRSLVRMLRIT